MDPSPNTRPSSLAGEAFRRGRLRLALSFRFGRPRGAFCHSGWCQQCKVALSDGRVGLACRLPASEIDALRAPILWRKPVSLIARRLRPWFHERVLFPHALLQQGFLGFVRRASGALPLGRPVVAAGRVREAACDVLVIGGGPAGSAAARALETRGVDVLLVDERPLVPGPTDPWRRAGTTVLGLYRAGPDGFLALCVDDAGSLQVAFSRLVVATGAYDRLLPIPGNDLPGIIGLQAFLKLAGAGQIPARYGLGLFAPSDAARKAAAAAGAAGLRFAWAAGSPDLPLDSAATVHRDAHPVRAAGGDRLRFVELSNGQAARCDVLVVGYRQPTYEFQLQAGQSARYGGSGFGIQTAGEAAMPLLTVGAAAGVGQDAAERTEEAVAEWLATGRTAPAHAFEPIPGGASLADEAIICPCEDVRVGDVRAALRDGFAGIEHVKRRTGAATGPCQGKLCHALLMQCLAESGSPPDLPTMRPLVRPTALASFAGRTND